MHINFIGPIGRVTGSCSWLFDPRTSYQLLVDCGMLQGCEASTTVGAAWNRGVFPFDPSEIGHVLLTHAHLDHCGLLPLLYRRGFTGEVICTLETRELAKVVLNDAAKHTDAYDKADVESIAWRVPARSSDDELFGRPYRLYDDVCCWFHRSSHLLGATTVRVAWGPQGPGQRAIQFSGDVGSSFEHAPSSFMLRHNMGVWQADYLVLESTYGASDKERGSAPLEARLGVLRERIAELPMSDDATLLIPAFAVGRSQEVLLDLHILQLREPALFDGLDVWLDSTMAQRASEVHARLLPRLEMTRRGSKPRWMAKALMHELGLNGKDPAHVARCGKLLALALRDEGAARPMASELPSWRPMTHYVRGRIDRDRAQRTRSVVVASGGMCSGGPVIHWLKWLLPRSTGRVALTGYCASGTPGSALMTHIEASDGTAHGVDIALPTMGHSRAGPQVEVIEAQRVAARVYRIDGYSAHAAVDGLLDTVFPLCRGERSVAASHVFLNHGDNRAREALRAHISKRSEELVMGGSYPAVEIPAQRSGWYDLVASGWLGAGGGPQRSLAVQLAMAEAEVARLRALVT